MLFYLHAAAVRICISKRLFEQRTGDVEDFLQVVQLSKHVQVRLRVPNVLYVRYVGAQALSNPLNAVRVELLPCSC